MVCNLGMSQTHYYLTSQPWCFQKMLCNYGHVSHFRLFQPTMVPKKDTPAQTTLNFPRDRHSKAGAAGERGRFQQQISVNSDASTTHSLEARGGVAF